MIVSIASHPHTRTIAWFWNFDESAISTTRSDTSISARLVIASKPLPQKMLAAAKSRGSEEEYFDVQVGNGCQCGGAVERKRVEVKRAAEAHYLRTRITHQARHDGQRVSDDGQHAVARQDGRQVGPCRSRVDSDDRVRAENIECSLRDRVLGCAGS